MRAELKGGGKLPVWLVFDAPTQTFSGTPPLDFNGDIQIQVIASDASSSVMDDFKLSVTPVNDPPVVANPLLIKPSQRDSAVSFTIPTNTFVDVDGDSLKLSASLDNGASLPSWLFFDNTKGSFSGTPPLNFNGDLFLKVTAADASSSVSDFFKLSITPVNDPPQIGEQFFTIPENSPAGFIVGTVVATDVDAGSTRTFAVVGGSGQSVFALNP